MRVEKRNAGELARAHTKSCLNELFLTIMTFDGEWRRCARRFAGLQIVLAEGGENLV